MLTRVVSVVIAVVVTVSTFFAYRLLVILPLFEPSYGVAQLVCALSFVGVSILLFRRMCGWPTLLLLVGSIGLTGAHLHDSFIELGLRYEWFQFGGTDGLVFRGFFEPRENPLLAVPAEIFRYTGLLTCVGAFWLALRLMQQHLTNR